MSSSSNTPLTAGIAGSGIAGLAAAIALRRAGFRVEVFERCSSAGEIGAAITSPPNATIVLDRWGFDFAAARAVVNRETRYAAADDLAPSIMCRYDREDFEAMGARPYTFHREDLHRGLMDLATAAGPWLGDDSDVDVDGGGDGDGIANERKREKRKGVPVIFRMGCEVESVDCEEGIIRLKDGGEVKKDLVVIADGAHTRLLASLLGRPASVEPTGRSVFRWLVPMDKIKADPALGLIYHNRVPGFDGWLDGAKSIAWISYLCRGGTMLNNAVVHDTEGSPYPDAPKSNGFGGKANGLTNEKLSPELDDQNAKPWHKMVPKEAVLETLSNFHPDARHLVSMASEDNIDVYQLFKRETLESFVRGKAVVLGDAAHVMMPTHAAGCAIAIESAAVLEVLFKGLIADMNSTADNDAPSTGEGPSNAGKQEGEVNVGTEKLIKERLRLFDELRIPRCNLTMLLSNAGPEGLATPGVDDEIRKYYQGPLPREGALPWFQETRQLLFWYNGFDEAERALKNQKGSQH